METLFAILFLASLCFLVVGLVKPGALKDKDKQPLSRKQAGIGFGLMALIFLILGGVFAPKTAPTAATHASSPSPISVAAKSSSPSPIKSTPKPATPKPTPTPKPAPTPAPTPRVLLDVSGNGIKQTQEFTTTGNWTMTYTFDCSAFGSEGNFQVYIYNGDGSLNDDSGPNELAPSGGDTDYYYDAGTHYLSVNSECSWHVTVTGK